MYVYGPWIKLKKKGCEFSWKSIFGNGNEKRDVRNVQPVSLKSYMKPFVIYRTICLVCTRYIFFIEESFFLKSLEWNFK